MAEISTDDYGWGVFPSVSFETIFLSLTDTVYMSLLLFNTANEEFDLYLDF